MAGFLNRTFRVYDAAIPTVNCLFTMGWHALVFVGPPKRVPACRRGRRHATRRKVISDSDSFPTGYASQMPEDRIDSTAVLLMAHGSRRESANADLVRLAEIVRSKNVYRIVEIGYLELAEPTIPQGARTCLDQGARVVLMLPFFLSAGAHVAGDLERYRSELSEEFPHVSFRLCPPLGLHPLIVDVVFDRLREEG